MIAACRRRRGAAQVSCRPGGGLDSDGTDFVIELREAGGRRRRKASAKPGRVFEMKAATAEECRSWIQAITELLASHAAAGADAVRADDAAAAFDDSALPATHTLMHRFRLLQEKRCTDFPNCTDFLVWRKRQLVVWASGLHWQLDHLQAMNQAAEVGLGQGRQKIDKQVQYLLDAVSVDAADWTGRDDADYEKKLQILADALEALQEEAFKCLSQEAGEVSR